ERNFLDSETLQSTIGDIVKRTLEETTKYQDKYMECEVTESTDDKLVIEIKPSTGVGDSKLANTADVINGGQNQHHESGAYESAEAVARQMNALNLQNVDDVGEWESESSSASSPVDKEDPNAPKSAFKSQTRKITKSVSFNETVMVENFKERSKMTQKKKPGKVESSFRTKERLKESSEEESESPRSPTSPLNFTDIPNVKEKNRPGSPKKGKNKSKSKNRENAKNKKSEDFAKKTMDSAGGDEKTEVTDSRTSRKNDASVDMKHKSNGKSGMAFANTLMYDLD
uniref:Pre-mRNA-splicing factor CWC22 homolog n=1 Tax=Saccoglossus kowalevskii TaxID=10224 RepID=A0ABM0M7C2_SACKO